MKNLEELLDSDYRCIYAYMNPSIVTKVADPSVDIILCALANTLDGCIDSIINLELSDATLLELVHLADDLDLCNCIPNQLLESITDPDVMGKVCFIIPSFETYMGLRNPSNEINNDNTLTSKDALDAMCSGTLETFEIIELADSFMPSFTRNDIIRIIEQDLGTAYTLCGYEYFYFTDYIEQFAKNCSADRLNMFLKYCTMLSDGYVNETTYNHILYAISHTPFDYNTIKSELKLLEQRFYMSFRVPAYIKYVDEGKRDDVNIFQEFTGKELETILKAEIKLCGTMTFEDFYNIQFSNYNLYNKLDYNNIKILHDSLVMTEEEVLQFLENPVFEYYLIYIIAIANRNTELGYVDNNLVDSKIYAVAFLKGYALMHIELLNAIDEDDFIRYLY